MNEQTQRLVITRTFDAPRELVFRAWTDPDHIATWWGPDGFHTPRESVEVELKAGGVYHLDMIQDEGGARFPLHYEILEVVEPELLVLKSPPIPEAGMPEPTITRVELRAEGDKTHMTLSDGPYPDSGHAEAGWTSSFARLDSLLASTPGVS